MSRIGKAPVTVPSGVDVTVNGGTITVKGPKGTLTRVLPGDIQVSQEDNVLTVTRPDDERQNRALHGLTRSLVNNMVVGVGYRAEAQGPTTLRLNLGFSHPVTVQAPDGITFEVTNPTNLAVVGIDKEVVGQVAANIRSIRKPEPYKGKGVRYQGERILRKAGKTGKR